jgi:hypothetical protein
MGYDADERMRELRRDWARQDAEREWRRRQTEYEVRQDRRRLDTDRLDAEIQAGKQALGGQPTVGPGESLELSEISEFPQPGYTHSNLHEAIQNAKDLMTAVASHPDFNFMSAYQKQELIVRLQISELKAGLALLRLDPMDHDRLMQINDLERQLGIGEEYLRNLTDPSHPIHHEWKSK